MITHSELNVFSGGTQEIGNKIGNLTLTNIGTPQAPTVTHTGATSNQLHSYVVVGIAPDGTHTLSSPTGSTLLGSAQLTSTWYNTITWKPVSGCSSYSIYRTVSPSISPTSTGKIATVFDGIGFGALSGLGNAAPLSINDTGLVGDNSTPPTSSSTTSNLTLSGNLIVSGGICDNSGSFGNFGQILTSQGTSQVLWSNATTSNNSFTSSYLTTSSFNSATSSLSVLTASYAYTASSLQSNSTLVNIKLSGSLTVNGNNLTASNSGTITVLGNSLDNWGNIQSNIIPSGSIVVILGDSRNTNTPGAYPSTALSSMSGFANIPIYNFAVAGTFAGPSGSVNSGQYMVSASSVPYIKFLNGSQVGTGSASISSLVPSTASIMYVFADYGANDINGTSYGINTQFTNFQSYMSSIYTTLHGFGTNVKVVVTTISGGDQVSGQSNYSLWNGWLRQQLVSLQGTGAAYGDYLADINSVFSILTRGTYTGDVWSTDGLHENAIGSKLYGYLMGDAILRNVTYPTTLGPHPDVQLRGYWGSSGGQPGYILTNGGTTGAGGSITTNAGTTGAGGVFNSAGVGSFSGGNVNTNASSTANGGTLKMMSWGNSGAGGNIDLYGGYGGGGNGGYIGGYNGIGYSAGQLNFYGGVSGSGGQLNIQGSSTGNGGQLNLNGTTNTIVTAGVSSYTLTLPAFANLTLADQTLMTSNSSSIATFNNVGRSETIYDASSSTITSLTITLPTTSVVGQKVTYATNATITSITMAGGSVIIGTSPTSAAVGNVFIWQCSTSGNWIRLQ